MKVAFATEDLQHTDAHFGWARHFAIYAVTPEGYRFVEAIQFEGEFREDGNEDKLAPRIDAIRDCAIVCVAAIGGSAAAKVVHAGVHPIKLPAGEPLVETLQRLVHTLNGTPPPWLRKALLKGAPRRTCFEEPEESEHA